jgi:HAE1 family hydrophobic/amphiphilic exporter-1
MFSKFFIDRPVLANVIALVTILIGALAFFRLPIAQYPNVVPPTIQVTATFPSGSARTIMEMVALPIEQQVNGVPGMLYMQSTSTSDGTYTLVVTFDIGTNADQAQVLVQNRVNAAMPRLPSAVQTQGVTVRKKSTAILEFVTLSSDNPRYDSLFLANYATIHLHDDLARLPGVGDVSVFGSDEYAIRVWLNPEKMQARGLAPADIKAAIQQQSQAVPTGQIGSPPTKNGQGFQYTLNVRGRLSEVADFENIIVKASTANGGQLTRLKDVARVELGARSYGQVFSLNGKKAAALAISQLPEANALAVAKTVEKRMTELGRKLPDGVHYSVPFNTTVFVNAAVVEVYKTLFEAFIIVMLVILFFLQDWRAMLVPATTVPVTLIGAFAAMAALGFSLNMSTLFALVLAIGIVVDDAIVIVEGAARHLEAGKSAREATIEAMRELFSPIMGITLVLISVFLPAAFLPGLTGQLYQQFSLVIAATAVISAINAVTLNPTQSALWMRVPDPNRRRNAVFRGFDRGFSSFERLYDRLILRVLKHPYMVSGGGLALAGLALFCLAMVPTSLLPLEDQGFLLISVQLPGGASLERTDKALGRVYELARQVPGVKDVISISGVSAMDNNASLSSSGLAYVVMKPWDERAQHEDLLSVYKALNAKLADLGDGKTLVVPPPSIQGIGNVGGFGMQVELQDGSFDFAKLDAVSASLAAAAVDSGGLTGIRRTSQFTAPQLDIDVDRAKAAAMALNVDSVYSALSSYLGRSYVDQFIRFGHTFQIFTQADSQFRDLQDDIGKIRVRNALGEMVPLSALVTVKPTVGPPLINLYNMYPSANVAGSQQPRISSGQAMRRMEKTADLHLGSGFGYEWTGMSYQEKLSGGQIYFVFLVALALVYLVLAGQYESWFSPFAVILSVPLAMLGTALTLLALGLSNSLYTQIGLILLVGLAAKNAILIVEFARDLRKQGKSIIEAAHMAGRLRLRPIIMTSIAFVFGMVPLMFANGAGAGASKSIGISVISGMLFSTFLAILVVPAFFAVIQTLEEKIKSR